MNTNVKWALIILAVGVAGYVAYTRSRPRQMSAEELEYIRPAPFSTEGDDELTPDDYERYTSGAIGLVEEGNTAEGSPYVGPWFAGYKRPKNKPRRNQWNTPDRPGGNMREPRKELTVITANMDFTRGRIQDKNDFQTLRERGDVLALQELNDTDVRDFFNDEKWRLRQRDMKEGSDHLTTIVSRHDIRGGGFGTFRAWTARPGVGMQSRDGAWQDLYLEGREIRFISVHFPPRRYRAQWAIYAGNLVQFVKRNPRKPHVISGDFNAGKDEMIMRALARTLNMRIVAPVEKNDFHLVDNRLRVSDVKAIRNTGSDHPFGQITIRWR